MTLKPSFTVGFCCCLYLLNACGPAEFTAEQEYMPPPDTTDPVFVEEEAVKDANLSIETTYRYGGLATRPRCDDGASGYGGTSNLLTNDGNNDAWIGAWRAGNFENDPNAGMRCSTSREYIRALEPNSWLQMKREILGLKLQNIAGHYRCDHMSIPCPSDSSSLSHNITIDDQSFTISWMTGIDEYLPPGLRRLNAILQMMDPPWSD